MQATMPKVHNPAKAREYFENKMAFTTGPVELERMIKSGQNGVNLIDVRAAEDYAKGHIPGAINLPEDRWDTLEGLQKERTNVVYCYTHVCHLGAKACVHFASRGFPVMELDGGFEVWKEYDLDIEPQPANRIKTPAR